jgi:hypothetical protein
MAAGVLYPIGIVLTPAAGTVLMSISTIIWLSTRVCSG